ncbi:MAG: regulator, partial [Bacteroidota bacterium]|nr:regulator [Bacteroidota bacterium]
MKKVFLLAILLSAGCFLLPVATSAQTTAGGGAFSLAICNNNSMMSWGDNLGGQLGIGLYSSIGKKSPVPINSLTGITAIAAGEYNCIALKNNGTVWTWGRNNFGQLGNGTNASYISGVPIQISGLTDVTAIAAGQYHCIALKNNGTVWAWG